MSKEYQCVTPAVKRHVFMSLNICPEIDMILIDQHDIDYDKIRQHVKSQDTLIDVNKNLRINIKAGLITLQGVQINEKTWIVCDKSGTKFMIPFNCKPDNIWECLEYMCHLHLSSSI